MASVESKFLKEIDDFVNINFDFLIVGGGTAGLVLAARLSENPNWTVGVLEAGKYVSGLLVEDASAWTGPSLVPSYMWQIHSVPQENLANRAIPLPTGRLLGGSSSSNYLLYMRGSKLDYDSWEAVGNSGWGWDGLLPYFKKAEGLISEDQPSLNSNNSTEGN